MLEDLEDRAKQLLLSQPVARLATVDAAGCPTVVPVCFVLYDGRFYSPIDDKPKSVSRGRLRRLRNIDANPSVSLVVDTYSHDWSELAYVLVSGSASIIAPNGPFGSDHAAAVALLRKKYPQYASSSIAQRPLIKIVPERVKFWAFAP